MMCKNFTEKQSGYQPILMGKGSYVQWRTALVKYGCNIAAERVLYCQPPAE
jgi:hypothetical protein